MPKYSFILGAKDKIRLESRCNCLDLLKSTKAELSGKKTKLCSIIQSHSNILKGLATFVYHFGCKCGFLLTCS